MHPSAPVSLAPRFTLNRFMPRWPVISPSRQATFIALVLLGIFALSPALAEPISAPIPWSDLGTQADQQQDPQAPTLEGDRARLAAPLQALDATLDTAGLQVASTSAAEGGGVFRLLPTQLDKGAEPWTLGPGTVAADGAAAILDRGAVREVVTASTLGLRQDFIVSQPPPGTGPLTLTLALQGARARQADANIELILPEGRALMYHGLHVSDADGRVLDSAMTTRGDNTLVITVADGNARYPLTIDPTITDADWQVWNPGLPGANGTILAMAVDATASRLYVGGTFTLIGNVLANGVAQWDGSAWSALGSGVNGLVRALAVSGSTLYVGGAFDNAGGTPAHCVAQWNGSAWSALGSGVNNWVLALAVSEGTLYVGGHFTAAGGIPANRIARWDGGAWSALGDGLNDSVYSLAARTVVILGVPVTTVYAGGGFTRASGIPASHIAQWRSSSGWSALGGGVNNTVFALAVSGGTLYAGGAFTEAGGYLANHIARWNGSEWSSLDLGVSDNVYALAVSGDTLYVGGEFSRASGTRANGVAQWNGSAWSRLSSGLMGSVGDIGVVAALAVSGTTLYVGGGFTTAGGTAANGVAQWDGGNWSVIGSQENAYGVNHRVRALAVSGNTLYVGGDFTTAGETAANRVARWDGSAWSPLGLGVNGPVNALAVSGSTLYVGGAFDNAGGTPANHLARWDGNTWSTLGSGVNSSVNAMAVSGTTLYVGGLFNNADGTSANRIARWDGSAWSALGSGVNGEVSALAVSGNTLYVGGDFTAAGGSAANFIARWNGGAWSTLGLGVNEIVQALAVATDGTLYVGGDFTTAGGSAANFIARWDGSAWSTLGGGVNERVQALAVASDGTLYVGGRDFTAAGGHPANRIARWDGTAWSALGSGVNGLVRALAVSGSTLYVCGDFTTAGGKFSPYAAMVHLPAANGYTLNVNSSGASGVAITATPAAYAGTTNYSRTGITPGASIALTAPATAGGASFGGWSGCDSTSGASCTVAMTQDRTVTATYSSGGCEEHIQLDNLTVTDTRSYTACRTLTATRFTAQSPAQVTFRAGERITLGTGFRVDSGARFTAQIDSSLRPAASRAATPFGHRTITAPAPAPAPLWPSSRALTWSDLPATLTTWLTDHDASIQDAQASADGQFIVFATDAALLAEDDNPHSDVYGYDSTTGQLSLISRTADGHAGDAASHSPRLNAAGERVLYLSRASDLVAGPSNGYQHVYRYDPLLEQTVRLSVTATGAPASGDSDQLLIAGDWAIYRTEAEDIGPEGAGIYRDHLDAPQHSLVGRDLWQRPDPRASQPTASADGNLLAYQRPNASEREQIHLSDLFRIDAIGQTEATQHGLPTLSADGRYLAYRERTDAGALWLRVVDRVEDREAVLPWPDPDMEQAAQFRRDGAELWWINPNQGLDYPEVRYRLENPLVP